MARALKGEGNLSGNGMRKAQRTSELREVEHRDWGRRGSVTRVLECQAIERGKCCGLICFRIDPVIRHIGRAPGGG